MRSLSRKCRQRTIRKVADTPKCTILSAAVRLALHWDGPQPVLENALTRVMMDQIFYGFTSFYLLWILFAGLVSAEQTPIAT